MTRSYSIAVAVALFVVGCASKTPQLASVLKSQKAYEEIRTDEKIQQYAPETLFQAGKLYALTKEVKDEAEARHLGYLLKQKVALSKEYAQEQFLREKLADMREEKVSARLKIKEQALLQAKEEAKIAKETAAGLEEKYQELQELNAKMTSRGLVLTLGDVLFETGKSTLLPGATRALEKLVAFLAENSTRKVLIEGHTDDVGSAAYNLDLSLRRAEAVADNLKKAGVEEARIMTRGYGEEFPVAGNDTDEGRQQNRRVEIVILNEGEEVEDIER